MATCGRPASSSGAGFLDDGDVDFILVAVIALACMAIGDALARASWIVLGAWGLLQTAEHFAAKWSSVEDVLFFLLPFPFFPFQEGSFEEDRTSAHQWAGPLVFVAAGLLFMAVALFPLAAAGTTFRARDSSSSTLEFRA